MKLHKETLDRFGLFDGQFFAHYKFKNLQWQLNGVDIGFGDLRDADLIRIMDALTDDEVFVGYNEHHGTDWQQTSEPMVTITRKRCEYRTKRGTPGVTVRIDEEAGMSGQTLFGDGITMNKVYEVWFRNAATPDFRGSEEEYAIYMRINSGLKNYLSACETRVVESE